MRTFLNAAVKRKQNMQIAAANSRSTENGRIARQIDGLNATRCAESAKSEFARALVGPQSPGLRRQRPGKRGARRFVCHGLRIPLLNAGSDLTLTTTALWRWATIAPKK